MEGLRERKQAATRQAISDRATRLFESRGFEAVTLAEIADAAEVSIKTIFNYFGSKEELFFDHEDEFLAGLLDTIRARDARVSPTAALRPLLLDGPMLDRRCRWRDITPELYMGIRAFMACENASPTLSARRLVIIHSWTEPLAHAGGSAGWAAMVVGIIALRHQLITAGFVADRPLRAIARSVRTTVGPALEALDRGFPAAASQSAPRTSPRHAFGKAASGRA